jgi:hypothetical protein
MIDIHVYLRNIGPLFFMESSFSQSLSLGSKLQWPFRFCLPEPHFDLDL